MSAHALTPQQLAESIPPAYTEFVGRALMAYLATGANASQGLTTPARQQPPAETLTFWGDL